MRPLPTSVGYGLVLGTGFAIGLALAAFPPDAASDWHRDHALQQRVDASIALHRALLPFDIAVAVDDGRVALSGSVDDGLERELAARLARSVDGVRSVDNGLRVEPDRARWLGRHSAQVAADPGDQALAVAVRAQLRWHRATRGMAIDVSSIAGMIVLRGRAPSDRLRATAERIAARTHGVLDVDNRIEVDQRARASALAAGDRLRDAWLLLRARSALLYASNVEGLDLGVEVEDGVVSLSGLVANRTELDLAVEIVGSIPGVRGIDLGQVRIDA